MQVLPKYMQLLQEVSAEMLAKMSASQKRYSARRFRILMNFMDSVLSNFNQNLETQNFQQILIEFWTKAVDGIDQKVRAGLEV